MTVKMPSEKMVYTARNALIAAGREMGAEGDHWPVIKSTVYSLMKEWEELKVEHNVHEELKRQFGVLLEKMEAELPNCRPEVRPQIERELAKMHEAYDACFSEVDEKAFDVSGMEMPAHIQRAKHIINTLEADDDTQA